MIMKMEKLNLTEHTFSTPGIIHKFITKCNNQKVVDLTPGLQILIGSIS